MEPSAYLGHLRQLVETMPDFGKGVDGPPSKETYQWLGRLDALATAKNDITNSVPLRSATSHLGTFTHSSAVGEIMAVLHRMTAAAEFALPSAAQGGFIAAGQVFDALATIARIIGEADRTVMLVDPYMSEKTLSDYGPMAKQGVALQLLTSAGKMKPGLLPAATAWVAQYRDLRPLSVRGVIGALLHDRSIVIDGVTAWNASQSLDAIAKRASASVVKLDAEIARDQIESFTALRDQSEELIA